MELTRTAEGKHCGNSGCPGDSMVLRSQRRKHPLCLGPSPEDTVELDLGEIDVCLCESCGYVYIGTDSKQLEAQRLYEALRNFWLEAQRQAGATPVELLKLRLLFRKVVESLPDPDRAILHFGRFLMSRPPADPAQKPRKQGKKGAK